MAVAETLQRAAEAVRRAGLQPAATRRRGLGEASRLVDSVRPMLADSDAPADLLRELHATTQRISEAMQVRGPAGRDNSSVAPFDAFSDEGFFGAGQDERFHEDSSK